MIEAAISRRYARALLELAKEGGSLDLFLLQLDEIKVLFTTNANLTDIISNRFLDLQARYRVVEEIGAKMGSNEDIIRFVKLLIKKGRVVLLLEIIATFKQFVLEAQNKVQAIITSAQALPESLYTDIQKEMSQKISREVLLDRVVDESVLGGVCVRIGNDVYDGTIKADLDRMKQQMMKSVII